MLPRTPPMQYPIPMASTKKPAPPKAAAKKLTNPSKTKARVLSSKLSFKGNVFSVYTDDIIEPGNIRTKKDVIRHNGSVVVLAVDDSVKDPLVIVERQYRHAAGQYLLELPAGRVEPGESTLAAAKREMIEETGYRARKWSLLVKYFASPGFLGEWMQIYLARDIREGAAQPEPDEKIEIFRMPLSQLLALAENGQIHDGKTLVALFLYQAGRKSGKF